MIWTNSLQLQNLNHEGKINGIIEINSDITDKLKTEEELSRIYNKLNIALENANIGTWEWDIKNSKVNWDKRTAKMFGHKVLSSESIGELIQTIKEEDIAHTKYAMELALEKNVPFETIIRTNVENRIKHINLKAVVNKDEKGEPYLVSGVCFDITEMKENTEKTLFKLNEELLRSNKELEQFAYVASHDLQEPLRMVTSYAQLLSKKYKKQFDEDATEYISFMVEGAHRMYALINDLLAYSRVNTKEIKLESIDVNNLINEIRFNLKSIIEEKQVNIVSGNLPIIKGDKTQMLQLIQNLLSNAIKFCKTKPEIEINFQENKADYKFSIKDNGIGIDEKYKDRIFLIFQRLHTKSEYQGTGIGLAICKKIVEKHGGNIWVESNAGQGSTFHFTIRK